jgi:two-component system, OmpR family, sensor kinase
VRISRGLRSLPLSVRLVAVVVLLVMVGLAVAGFTATSALRSYLLKRTDDQLRAAAVQQVDHHPGDADCGLGLDRGDSTGGPNGAPVAGPPPSEFYVATFDASGRLTCTYNHPLRSDESPPKLPTLSLTQATAASREPFTVQSVDSGTAWRVMIVVARDGTGSVAIATSLADVHHTVVTLTVVELVVGLVVVVVLAAVAYLVIRRSLRPLVEVEATAEAIAAGDLSRRVEEGHPRTEVGRLSRALNGMLGQIESAFARQQESEQSARASEARMRRFVADASHELRTPLTSIRGFAELYRIGAVDDQAELDRVMRRVEDEAARMGLLVEDLLMLARLDRQRPLDLAPVDLLVVASDAVHDAQLIEPDRSITLDVSTDAGPPIVMGDEPRLRQVVHNLVGNTLTHTPPGTAVTVALRTEVRDGLTVVVLDVSDRGPGLSPDAAARVFERFYRADPSRSRDAGGTGLGLAIVSGLVRAHGGTVSVESTPGEGATFRVVLPVATHSRPPASVQ